MKANALEANLIYTSTIRTLSSALEQTKQEKADLEQSSPGRKVPPPPPEKDRSQLTPYEKFVHPSSQSMQAPNLDAIGEPPSEPSVPSPIGDEESTAEQDADQTEVEATRNNEFTHSGPITFFDGPIQQLNPKTKKKVSSGRKFLCLHYKS